MALSFNVSPSARLALSLPSNWVTAFIARRRARRVETEAIKRLRQFDRHLLADINLDQEALWRSHPCIRQLSSAYLVATGLDRRNP